MLKSFFNRLQGLIMVKNELFRQRLAAVSTEQKAQLELLFGIEGRIHEVLSKKGLTKKSLQNSYINVSQKYLNGLQEGITLQYKLSLR